MQRASMWPIKEVRKEGQITSPHIFLSRDFFLSFQSLRNVADSKRSNKIGTTLSRQLVHDPTLNVK